MDQILESDSVNPNADNKTNNLVVRVKIDKTPGSINLDDLDLGIRSYDKVKVSVAVVLFLIFILAAGYFSFSGLIKEKLLPVFKAPDFVSENMEQLSPAVSVPNPIVFPAENTVESAVEKKIETKIKKAVENPIVDSVFMVENAKPADVVLLEEKSENLGNENITADVIGDSGSPVVDMVKKPHEVNNNLVLESSENILRAQFTSNIVRREPVDFLERLVPVGSIRQEDEKNLEKIYFFTELVGLSGETIRHQWFHKSELISELTFNIGGNRWRVNSSKRLGVLSIGEWQVKVVNRQDEILLTKMFDYRRL